MQKYALLGYVRFLFIDASPQSFYGCTTGGGCPRRVRAFEEANQPLGVFLEHREGAGLWAVNDLLEAFPGASALDRRTATARCSPPRAAGGLAADSACAWRASRCVRDGSATRSGS